MRIKDGDVFESKNGHRIMVERNSGGDISYNESGTVQWLGGRCTCRRAKFVKMIEDGGYTLT